MCIVEQRRNAFILNLQSRQQITDHLHTPNDSQGLINVSLIQGDQNYNAENLLVSD